MPLPLPLEIVGTDRSQGDNEGAVRELGVVGGWQKTRAVPSLETRMQVVASIEVLTCWEVMVLYVLEALQSVRHEL